MTDTNRYSREWSDPRMKYGNPNVQFEPIKVAWWAKDWAMYFAYFMFIISASMAIAPMAWVLFFKWVCA